MQYEQKKEKKRHLKKDGLWTADDAIIHNLLPYYVFPINGVVRGLATDVGASKQVCHILRVCYQPYWN